MDRFMVVQEKNYCWIKDCMAIEYKMPERGVAINFTSYASAEWVVNILNVEWRKFEQKPE